MEKNILEFVNIDINHIAAIVTNLNSSADILEKKILNSDFDWEEFHASLNLILVKIHKHRKQCYRLVGFIQELESVLKVLSALPT